MTARNKTIGKILASMIALTFVVILICVNGIIVAFAAKSSYAALKGFTVSDDMSLVGELNTERYAFADNYGNISLWSARYLVWDQQNDKAYITVLAEATMYASGDGHVNEQMSITISHEGNKCDTPAYHPQVSDGGSISENTTVGGSASTDGLEINYSYSNTHTYSEVNLAPELPPPQYSGVKETKSVIFNFNFIDYESSGNWNRSPYIGAVVQRMSVTFMIRDWSKSSYDTDYDMTRVTFVGTTYKSPILWFNGHRTRTIEHEICDRWASADTYALSENTLSHDVKTTVRKY